MTFIDAAAQSKTFGRAWGRPHRGLRQARAVVAPRLAGHQAALPPLGAGANLDHHATGTMAVALGGLYSTLFHLPLAEHLLRHPRADHLEPDQRSILEAPTCSSRTRASSNNFRPPLSVHVYRLVWRQIILFAHNIVIFVIIAIIFPPTVEVDRPGVHPRADVDLVELRVGGAVLRHPGHPIPRHQPLLFSLVQLLFYVTPIIWNDQTLRQQGAGTWAKVIEFNPLLHYVDIVRAPLLGGRPGASALGGGHRADRGRLDRHGLRDAAVPLPGAVLGLTSGAAPSSAWRR